MAQRFLSKDQQLSVKRVAGADRLGRRRSKVGGRSRLLGSGDGSRSWDFNVEDETSFTIREKRFGSIVQIEMQQIVYYSQVRAPKEGSQDISDSL